MQWQLSLNSLILGTAAVCALVLALIMTKRPVAPGSRTVLWLCIAIGVWAGADALESASIPIPQKIWCAKVAYLVSPAFHQSGFICRRI